MRVQALLTGSRALQEAAFLYAQVMAAMAFTPHFAVRSHP
jgi:hypothetical protein